MRSPVPHTVPLDAIADVPGHREEALKRNWSVPKEAAK